MNEKEKPEEKKKKETDQVDSGGLQVDPPEPTMPANQEQDDPGQEEQPEIQVPLTTAMDSAADDAKTDTGSISVTNQTKEQFDAATINNIKQQVLNAMGLESLDQLQGILTKRTPAAVKILKKKLGAKAKKEVKRLHKYHLQHARYHCQSTPPTTAPCAHPHCNSKLNLKTSNESNECAKCGSKPEVSFMYSCPTHNYLCVGCVSALVAARIKCGGSSRITGSRAAWNKYRRDVRKVLAGWKKKGGKTVIPKKPSQEILQVGAGDYEDVIEEEDEIEEPGLSQDSPSTPRRSNRKRNPLRHVLTDMTEDKMNKQMEKDDDPEASGTNYDPAIEVVTKPKTNKVPTIINSDEDDEQSDELGSAASDGSYHNHNHKTEMSCESATDSDLDAEMAEINANAAKPKAPPKPRPPRIPKKNFNWELANTASANSLQKTIERKQAKEGLKLLFNHYRKDWDNNDPLWDTNNLRQAQLVSNRFRHIEEAWSRIGIAGESRFERMVAEQGIAYKIYTRNRYLVDARIRRLKDKMSQGWLPKQKARDSKKTRAVKKDKKNKGELDKLQLQKLMKKKKNKAKKKVDTRCIKLSDRATKVAVKAKRCKNPALRRAAAIRAELTTPKIPISTYAKGPGPSIDVCIPIFLGSLPFVSHVLFLFFRNFFSLNFSALLLDSTRSHIILHLYSLFTGRCTHKSRRIRSMRWLPFIDRSPWNPYTWSTPSAVSHTPVEDFPFTFECT